MVKLHLNLTKRLLNALAIWLIANWLIIAPASAAITFRGAWVATVANIDWPTPEAINNDSLQQTEFIQLIDSLQAIGINAIIFQVRPTADALYESELEPASHWLSGKQNQPMNYDPLYFAVKECHKRGMELHAWLNPYRVNINQMDTSVLYHSHLMRQHPDWFWQYGAQWFFNPALEQTREWLCMVVDDIVCRYDIDAIHMDDYFYPYPIGKKPLPDTEDFVHHPHGFTNINDWRRNNVNLTVKAISETIHKAKPQVQFGISPFGIYKSDGSTLSNYTDLYADVLYWISEGWIDYVTPQLYWNIGNERSDYAQLAHWWAAAVDSCNAECRMHNAECTMHNAQCTMHNAQLYIGMAPYRLGGKDAWSKGNEIARQMRLNRQIEGITGECFYSTRPLLKNPLSVCDSIKAIYNE